MSIFLRLRKAWKKFICKKDYSPYNILNNGSHDLFEAIVDCNVTEVMLLIERKVNVNSRNSEMATPLITVCQTASAETEDDYLALGSRLIDTGASIFKKDIFRKTALDYAEENGLMKIQELLHCTHDSIINANIYSLS